MLFPREHWINPEEYLEIDRASDLKHEYDSGHMYALAGGTQAHARIAYNKELSMSTQYVEFMQQNPLFLETLRQREAESWAAGKIEGEIEMILQLLHTHFSETMAELAELALRRVDIQDAEVIGPLKEAAVKLDEQGVNRWVKDHLPAE